MVVKVKDIAYCAVVGRNNIQEVLNLILKPGQKNTMTSILFNITQNRFLMCPSPFSSELERKMMQHCTAVSAEMSVIVQRLAENRKVSILKKGGKIVMMNQAEELVMAESKVKRNITTKKIELRRIDSKSLVKLLHNVNPTSRISSGNNAARNSSKVTRISPREVQRDERFEIQFPFENNTFNNPSHPNQVNNRDDKLPIQATELDTDGLSMQMAINAPSMFSSRNETKVPYRFSNASSSAALATPTTRSGQTVDSSSFLASVPRYPVYMKDEKRLLTFQTPLWQRFEKPDLAHFVQQGFFFTGREDLVRCYMCGIGLKDWVKTDVVMQEHVKHSPKCDYLLHKFGKSELDRIQAGISSGVPSISSGSQVPYKIRSPQYQTMEARLATFKSFPSNITIPHQQLAVAGLYFTGKGDLCRCFTCDGGLKDWSEGDDPCREHATYFSQCDYINQLKGQDYVRTLQQRRQNNQPTGAAGGASQPMLETSALQSMEKLHISDCDDSGSTVGQIIGMGYSRIDVVTAKAELERRGDTNPNLQSILNTILDMQDQENIPTASAHRDPEGGLKGNHAINTTALTDTNHEDLQAIAEENGRLSQMVQCMLCVEEEPDILFLPCAHHRICHKCSENITHCPVCNNYIKEKVRTYRA